METNQMMSVQIGSFGTIQIGHKDMMGSVSQVVEMGNRNRRAKHLEEIPLKEILRKQYFWEFVISRETQIKRKFKCGESPHFQNSDSIDIVSMQSNYTDLEAYKEHGQIKYSELMKKFPNLIKSKRGRNGGTWAELYILLKIASMLDKDLEVEIYEVFVENKILFWRDIGGDNFKEFNEVVDTLPDRVGKSNIGIYIQVSTKIRRKLKILDTKGYNEKEHNALIQENRAEWLKSLTFAVKVGLIKSYEDLKDVLDKLDVIQ